MTKFKKQRGYYRVSVSIDGKREEKYFKKLEDAKMWKAERTRERAFLSVGMDRPNKDLQFKDYVSSWMKERVKTRPKSTWSQDESRLRLKIIPKFGARTLTSIKAQEIKDFLDSVMDSGNSKATRNRYRSLLRKIFGDALKEGRVVHNPVAGIQMISEKKMSYEYWKDVKDIQKYMQAAHEQGGLFYLFSLIALNTGMRVSEILALEWSDINLEKRTIFVGKIVERISGEVVNRTKGNTRRLVPMNDTLAQAFEGFEGDRSTWLFPSPLNDGPRTYFWARDAHERAVVTAKVSVMSLHGLRHTFASHYLMNGGSKSELKEVLGHSSELVTEIYSHIAQDHLRTRINVVGFGTLLREKCGKQD